MIHQKGDKNSAKIAQNGRKKQLKTGARKCYNIKFEWITLGTANYRLNKGNEFANEYNCKSAITLLPPPVK